MAEATGSPLNQPLEDVFAEFSDELAGTILDELTARKLTAVIASDPVGPSAASDRNERAWVALDILITGEEPVWSAWLEAVVEDAETMLTAEHLLVRSSGDIAGWSKSTSVKTETGEQRPELRETAATLMRALADEKSIMEAAEAFDLETLDEIEVRQQTAPDSAAQRHVPPKPPHEIGLSASVRSVANAVADRETVTAVDIAEALRGIHPEYAGGQSGCWIWIRLQPGRRRSAGTSESRASERCSTRKRSRAPRR